MNTTVKAISKNSVLKVGTQKIRFTLLWYVTPTGKAQPKVPYYFRTINFLFKLMLHVMKHFTQKSNCFIFWRRTKVH